MKVGVIKTGNIASSLVLELLLDERADRTDLEVFVITSGAKMDPAGAVSAAEELLKDDFDLILYTTPNASAPGPKKVIELLKGKRAVVVSDAPGIKMKDVLVENGLGYIFLKGDSMIGARREFLDPVEMALFNAEMLKVLGITGALRLLQKEIGMALKEDYLPRVVVGSQRAVAEAGFKNPYALSKAMAAYEMIEKVGDLDVKGCFMTKEAEKYIPLVSTAHEMLRAASLLADEAREIEKSNDKVLRTPHATDGRVLEKFNLMEKPK